MQIMVSLSSTIDRGNEVSVLGQPLRPVLREGTTISGTISNAVFRSIRSRSGLTDLTEHYSSRFSRRP